MRLTLQDAQRRGLIGRVEVYVDGEKMERCIEADEEAGYVLCYLGSRPNIILDPAGHIIPIRVVGKVEIRIRGSAA